MILRSPLRNGGTTTWRRAHRPTTDREPELRADRYKYGYRSCRMAIARAVRLSEERGDVTLARVRWMGAGR